MASRICQFLKLKSPVSCNHKSFSSRPSQEMKIPVPFGHMAAKVFGPSDGQPVLALHGWQENAGTFDLLVPHLDPSLRIVALDLPGHGLSSHLPPGGTYRFLDYMPHVKATLDHLKWTKCSLLGHSFGGALSLVFAGVFPDVVESVVSLDILKPFSVPQDGLIEQSRTVVEKSLELFGKSKRAPLVYSRDEAVDRLVKGSWVLLSTRSAEVILKRGSTLSDNGKGIVFTRDVRLNILITDLTDEVSCKTYLDGVKCNLLVTKSSQGLERESSETVRTYKTTFAQNCQRFFYKELEGLHHVHIDDPEAVAGLVNPFLLKRYREL